MTLEAAESRTTMIRAREDRLFARFCRTGDPGALGAAFDRTAPELWRVASYLTRDRHMAEDAVQSTFLAAIEHHGDWDPKRSFRSWLLGLLANRVRELRRKEARSIDADLLGTKQAPRPEESAQQAELEAAFLSALDDVPEPQRSALEGHLVQGKSPSEMAQELGVPAGTVRMRLHRGLDQLRRRLPAGVSPTFALAGLPPADVLASLRRAVLAAASKVGPASGSTASTALPLGLGLFVVKKSLFVLVALLIAGIGAAFLRIVIADPAGLDESTKVLSLRTVPPSDLANLPSPLAALETGTGTREAATTAVEGPSTTSPTLPAGWGILNLKFVEAGTGEIVPGLVFQLEPTAKPRLRRLARTDEAGAFSQEVLAGEVDVSCDMIEFGSSLRFDVEAGMITEGVIELPHRLQASITVEGPDGYPVAGARVVGWSALDGVKTWDEPIVGNTVERELGVTDAQGRLVLRMMDASLTVRATLGGLAASRVVEVKGGAHDVVLRLGNEPATVRGTVTGYEGLLVPLAPVWLQRLAVPAESAVRTIADADGHFVAADLPPGPYRVYARAAAAAAGSGARATFKEIELPPGGDAQADLTFANGARAVLVTFDADSEPLVGEIFVARRLVDDEAHASAELNASDGYTDGQGRCELADLAPGDYELSCLTRSGRVFKERTRLLEGETFEWRPATTGDGRVDVEVVAPGQRPLEAWIVQLLDEEGRSVITGLTDESGRARLEGLTSGPFIMRVRATRTTPSSHEEEVDVGSNVRVQIAAEGLPEGSIVGRIRVDQSVAVAELAVRVLAAPGPLATAQLNRVDQVQVEASGSFSVDGLPAGHYVLTVLHSETGKRLAVRSFHLQGAQRRLDLGVVVAVPSELRISVGSAVTDGESDLQLWMTQSSSEGAVLTRAPFRRVANELVVRDMPAGTYSSVVWGSAVGPVRLSIPVGTAQASTFLAPIEACPTVRLELQGTRPRNSTLTFQFEDGRVMTLQHQEGDPLAFGIPLGSHHVTLRSRGKELASARFEVGPAGSPRVVLACQ